MDRQTVSGETHRRLLELEHAAKGKKTLRWQPAAVLAACCALVVGVGARQAFLAAEERPVPSAAQPTQGLLHTQVPRQQGDTASNGFANMMFPCIPYIAYPDQTDAQGWDRSQAIALREGSFERELTEEQVCLILWGSQERMDAARGQEKPYNVPWMLFWDGFALTGRAQYDNTGSLCQAYLQGSHQDGRSFSITLAPGQIPPTCVVSNGAGTSEYNGVEIAAWQMRHDYGGTVKYVYESAFLAHGIGIRAMFTIPEGEKVTTADKEPDYSMLSTLFIRWACGEPGMSLDHLIQAEEVPAFRSAEFENLAQARQEADFAPYLPRTDFTDYGEFYGHLYWQEGIQNRLNLRWSRGYDDVSISVALPEGGGPAEEAVDIGAPETYDLRLYSIPWCDSVPFEYLSSVSCPTFRAADMSRELVEARRNAKDTGGNTYSFCVLHENGVLVKYRCDGLSADQVWALVEPTLSAGEG